MVKYLPADNICPIHGKLSIVEIIPQRKSFICKYCKRDYMQNYRKSGKYILETNSKGTAQLQKLKAYANKIIAKEVVQANAIVKHCRTCGDLTLAQCSVFVWHGKTYRRCKVCLAARMRAKRQANPIAEKERHRDYWANNKDAITKRRAQPERLAKRRKQHKEVYGKRYAEHYRKKQAEYKETLADCYVKKVIQNGNKAIKFSDIPQGMVELKRAMLKLKKGLLKARLDSKQNSTNTNLHNINGDTNDNE